MKTPSEILHNLARFSGTEQFTRFSPLFPKLLATDGIIYLAQECQSYWMLDIIGSVQQMPKIKAEGFLTVIYNKKAGKVVISDGNGNMLYEQTVSSPTFPLNEIKLFVCDGEAGMRIVMLPQEY